MIEVEVKLPIRDREKTEADLKRMGFQPGESVLETDTYFDNAENQIRNGGQALRVRSVRDLETGIVKSVVTFKGKKLDQVSMTRQELETGIECAEVMTDLFAALGYEPVLPKVVKRRCEYHLDLLHGSENTMTACLDTVEGLGEYLELEILVEDETGQDAALEEIGKVLGSLGYAMEDTTTTSYLTQLQRKQASLNS